MAIGVCGARLVYELDIEDLNGTACNCIEFPDEDVDFFCRMDNGRDLADNFTFPSELQYMYPICLFCVQL